MILLHAQFLLIDTRLILKQHSRRFAPEATIVGHIYCFFSFPRGGLNLSSKVEIGCTITEKRFRTSFHLVLIPSRSRTENHPHRLTLVGGFLVCRYRGMALPYAFSGHL